MVARYGADSARMNSLFAAPPDRDLDWQDKGVEGIQRFLSRVYRYVARHSDKSKLEARLAASSLNTASGSPEARQIQRKLHQTIKRVTDDFQGRWHFNTCVAAIMELVNELYAVEDSVARAPAKVVPIEILAEVQRDLVLLLAPFAPYLAHELWEMLGEKGSLLKALWPKYDPLLAKEEEIEVPVQVNGKLRSLVIVPVDASEEILREHALANEKIKAVIAGKQIVKVIVVPGKLVNIVVR
jgi:leucyl-tRNA synthetase